MGLLSCFALEEGKLEMTQENWRLPRNCTLVQEGKDGGACIRVVGQATVYSSTDFAVDPEKTYRITGSFKSVGETEGRVFLGVFPLDEQKRFIAPNMINCVSGTETELAAACSPEDTVIKVKDGSKWRKVSHGVVAFEVDDSGEFADLPNRNLSTPGIENTEEKDGYWEITLARPCGKEYSAGTKVRQQQSGATFIYCGASNQAVPKEWRTYTGQVSGIHKGATHRRRFRPGTAYVRVGILANHGGNQENIMLIDDIKLELVD